MRFCCRKCRRQYEIRDGDLGKRVECACGHHFTPSRSNFALFADNEHLFFHCPECGTEKLGHPGRKKRPCPCGGKLLSPMELALHLVNRSRQAEKPDQSPLKRRLPACCCLLLMLLAAAVIVWKAVSCISGGLAAPAAAMPPPPASKSS